MNFSGCLLLKYFGYYSFKHWDDYKMDDMNILPTSLRYEWPKGLYVSELEQLMPTLISNRCFLNNQLFPIDIFDMTMVY